MRFFILACALATAVVANDIIEGEYMVRVNPEILKSDAEFTQLFKSLDADIQKFYHMEPLVLMHVKADEKAIARVQGLPEVLYVEPNQYFYTTQTCNVVSCPGVWGLDRVDQNQDLPYSSPSDSNAVYEWGTDTGLGCNAYIVDTGILTTHNDFGDRATWGYSAGNLGNEDGNGHGTHCAGTVGGIEYGLAKNATLIAVKVMTDGGFGSTADIVEGMNWVALQNGAGDRSSVNLSLGGGASISLDDAVARLVADGVSTVCAAGNSDADACNSSPGRAPDCITVGATDVEDTTATFTNYGTCVDVFAPGVSILSTWIGSNTNTNRISGTSMACPHVVGAVARFQSSQGTAPSPAAVATYIVGQATPNVINFRAGHGNSPNLLLYAPCVNNTQATPDVITFRV